MLMLKTFVKKRATYFTYMYVNFKNFEPKLYQDYYGQRIVVFFYSDRKKVRIIKKLGAFSGLKPILEFS